MDTVGSDMHASAPSRRTPSSPQRRRRDGPWAILIGIVTPLGFLALDPIEGTGAGMMDFVRSPLLRAHAGSGYVLLALALLAFVAALLVPRRAAWFAGPACVGTPVLALLGTALLPATLGAAALLAAIALAAFLAAGIASRRWRRRVGVLVAAGLAVALLTAAPEPLLLLLGLGVLGLLPFGAAAAHLRTARRALRRVPRRRRTRAKVLALALGVLAVAISVQVQRVIDGRAHALVEAAWTGDDSALDDAIDGLRPFGWLADLAIPFARAGWPVDTPPYRRLRAAWLASGGIDIEVLPDYQTLPQGDSAP